MAPKHKIELVHVRGMEVDRARLSACGPEGARYLHQGCSPAIETQGSYDQSGECTGEWHSGCKLGPGWTYEFYNVLWVEEHDEKPGTWIREGLGKVWAQHWQRQGPVDIDMTLC